MTDSTAQVNFTPVNIDYTNRDFYSLRDDMISRVKDRIPGWIGSDPSDFGVALIEAFSYMGDIAGYYIDRVANETSLVTASQRNSVINLAQTYGYNPVGYQAATCSLTFTYGSPASVTIPAKTIVYGNFVDGEITRQIKFSTTAAITVNPTLPVTSVSRTVGSSTATVLAVGHGFPTGSSVLVSGLIGSASGLNGTWTIQTTTTVTAASGNGTTVTYTTPSNTYTVGQSVTIVGLSTTTGAPLNLTAVAITGLVGTAGAYTGFTVASSAIGTASGTQAGTVVTPDNFTFTSSATTAIGPLTGLTGSVVYATGSSATVTGVQGYYISSVDLQSSTDSTDIAGEPLGQSDGTPAQTFTLVQSPVVDGTTRVFVKNGSVYSEWSYVVHLSDYGPGDSVFTTFFDENGYVTVLFGDGVSGAIPPRSEYIKAEYLVGGGVVGNVPVSGVTSWYSVPGLSSAGLATLAASVTVTNPTSGSGGADPDSIAAMKAKAPLAFASLNRAVTLADYASLALQIPTVGKANAVAQSSSSVTLYVGPRQGPTVGDPYPLYTPPASNTIAPSVLTAKWDAGDGLTGLKYDALNGLTPKVQIGVSLTVLPPTYVLINLGITYTALPQYTSGLGGQVEAQITALLDAYYSYALSSFAQTIYPGDIELLLRYAPGVANVSVTSLYKTGDIAARNIIVGQPNELFILTTASSGSGSTTTLVSAKSTSALSALAVASSPTAGAALGAAFSATLYNYSVATILANTSMLVTPAVSSADLSTIYVNNVLYSSPTVVNTSGVAIPISNASVTVTSGTGSVMTYTAANAFTAGQLVTVTGASVTGYNVTSAVITSATTTQFTVAGTAVGASTGTIVAVPTTAVVVRVVAQDGTSLSNYNLSITKS